MKRKEAKLRQSKGAAAAPPDAGLLARRAEAALLRGEVDVACQLLSQVRPPLVGSTHLELRARAYTLQAYTRLGKPARAIASVERAIESAPERADLHGLYGNLLRRSGAKKRAISEFAEARRLAPEDSGIAYESLLARLAGDQRGEEVKALAAAVEAPVAPRASALVAVVGGDLEEAERAAAASEHPADRLIRAVLLVAQHEVCRALPLLEDIAGQERLPGVARAYANFYLGIAHLQRRELALAVDALERAAELGAPETPVRAQLVWAYEQLAVDAVLSGELAVAADWFDRLAGLGGPGATAARDNAAHALILLGQERAGASNYEEAASAWSRALEIAPRDVALRQNLAVALERAGRGDEAIPHWHELARQVPRGIGGEARRGAAERAAPEDEELRRNVRAVAHRHLADLYLEQDELGRAIDQLERALQAVPSDLDVRRFLAQLLVEDGQARKATAQYEQVVAAVPNSAVDHVALGLVLLTSDGGQAAFDHLERALALEPEDPAVRSSLGVALMRRVSSSPDAAAALEDAQRALDLVPPDTESYAMALAVRGAAQLARGDLRAANKSMKEAIKRSRNKGAATIRIGDIYWKAGHKDAAITAWTGAMKQAKAQPHYYVSLAESWAAAGETARCRECLEAALTFLDGYEVIPTIEGMAKSRELLPLVRRVVQEMAGSAEDPLFRVNVAEMLIHVADPQGARGLLNAAATEAVEQGDEEAIHAAIDVDWRYRLLDRRSSRALANWLDAHPEALEQELGGV